MPHLFSAMKFSACIFPSFPQSLNSTLFLVIPVLLLKSVDFGLYIPDVVIIELMVVGIQSFGGTMRIIPNKLLWLVELF